MRQAMAFDLEEVKEEERVGLYKLKIRQLVFLLEKNPDYRETIIQRAARQAPEDKIGLFCGEVYKSAREYPAVFRFLLKLNFPIPDDFVYPVQEIDFEELATQLDELGPVQKGFLLERIERGFLVRKESEYLVKQLLNTVVKRMNGLEKPLRSKPWETWSWLVTTYVPWLDLDSGTSSVPNLKLWTLPRVYPTRMDWAEKENGEAMVFPPEPTEQNLNLQSYYLGLRLKQLHKANPGFFPSGIRQLLINFLLLENTNGNERIQRSFLSEYLKGTGLLALASEKGIDFLLKTVKMNGGGE